MSKLNPKPSNVHPLLYSITHVATRGILTPTCTILVRSVQKQLEARIYRPGQTRDVKIVHLYMGCTVEETLVKRVPGFTVWPPAM